LVFGTLHTVDSIQTVDRIVDVFPTHQQQQIRMQLSVNLVGVVSQTLIKRKDGRGRVAAHEVMVATSAIRNLIRESKTYQIGSIIQTGARQKMTTLDQALANLVERGLVTREDARMRAKDPLEFDRLLALDEKKHAQAGSTPGGAQAAANRPPTTTNGQPTAPPQVGPTHNNPSHHPHAPVRNQPNRPAYRRD
jgi:twitching motility protein PilT